MKKNINAHTNKPLQNNNSVPLPSDLTCQTQPIVNNQPALSIYNQSLSKRTIQVADQCMPLNNNSLNPDKDTSVHHSTLPLLDFSNLYPDAIIDLTYFPSKDDIEKVKAEFIQQLDQ